MMQTVHQYIHRAVRLGYLLYVPIASPDETRRKHPVILFLHGMGERGSDPNLLKNYGLTRALDEGLDLPFIVIAPQCPDDQYWPYMPDALIALIDHVIQHQFGDPQRVYLTGASMGGYGAWMLGSQYPHRFAAIAPICGVAPQPTEQACTLKDSAVWAIHGDADPVVPPQETAATILALRACGGDPQVTYVPGADHSLGTTIYHDRALYDWFLQHRLP